ncbi:hypothetical protein I350_06505 [Cryptococcus amylolentus CBS 6273]|uniref:Uncharacterized protein n=1 Tax=Cryptococcus amylolentus CBS 6273 TaxID=1296118 RepID=A0A1E3JLC7_9TREE|nr:hypothetical protein I350_06505 [Cryptococcus amylolentus CBS 6273]
MPCTCAPASGLLSPLPFPPEIKNRILHFLLTTTTCNSHFIDLLCLEKAVYAFHAKELYRQVTLDGDSVAALWKGCDFDVDQDQLPDESVLELYSDEKQNPTSRIPFSYPSAVRKLLLIRHCSSLHLRTGDAADCSPGSVPESLLPIMERLHVSVPLFCGVQNLIIGEEYLAYISGALEAGMDFVRPLGFISEIIPRTLSSVCIYWPDEAHEGLGEELNDLLSSKTLVCKKLVIHNADPDQLPPIFDIQELVLDLTPEAYIKGMDERRLGHKKIHTCYRWLTTLVEELLSSADNGHAIRSLPDLTFANLYTWKSSTPNSVLRYNTDVELGGDGWSDDTGTVVYDAACGFSAEEQRVLEDFFPRDMGPRYCHCCAPFVPQGAVDLWHYVGAKNKKGEVYDRVSKEDVYDRIFRDFGL